MNHPIDELFATLVEKGGSDLHLLETQPPKIRRHGEVVPIRDAPLTRDDMVRLLQPICSPPAWKKYTETGDLDFAYEMDEENRFRCNFYKQLHGYGAVFRIIPTKIKTLKELGVPPVIESFGNYKSGLILVTGPTGSGKSTTLAAVVDS
ncbi:MAG: type IV pili twitching motility protein PilT, partial [Verrucomicrobia bacterium]|nr:type IV pili twitching motility protein PilT [Verrucomicrobiota bacterium]